MVTSATTDQAQNILYVYLYLYLYLYGDLQIPRWDITQMGVCASLMAARWAGRAHRRWWWRRHSLGRESCSIVRQFGGRMHVYKRLRWQGYGGICVYGLLEFLSRPLQVGRRWGQQPGRALSYTSRLAWYPVSCSRGFPSRGFSAWRWHSNPEGVNSQNEVRSPSLLLKCGEGMFLQKSFQM